MAATVSMMALAAFVAAASYYYFVVVEDGVRVSESNREKYYDQNVAHQ